MKPTTNHFYGASLLLILGVSQLCEGQVTRTSLPNTTNPGTLAIGISGGVRDVALNIGSCQMFIYGVTGGSGSPGPGGYTGTGVTLGGHAGVIGATQIQVIESPQCALNLATSSNLSQGYILQPSLNITLKGTLASGTKVIEVRYSQDFCEPDFCGSEQVWDNLGDWTDVPQGNPAILSVR